MYGYHSKFSEPIQGMLAFKERLGYARSTHEPSLRSFDSFCATHYPKEKTLTEELALSWLQKRQRENSGGLKKRANTLRQFGKYLNYMEQPAYVLPYDYVGGRSSFFPYILSDEEIADFFHAADSFPKSKFSLCRHYIVSVIFRLIYCCGLRPNEGRLLKLEDVDLQTGQLQIRDTKKNRDRIVMMSDDMTELCNRYDSILRKMMPDRKYFFSNMNGESYAPNTLIHMFRLCWKMAGGDIRAKRTPRIYDLRHRFATAAIMRWMDEGQDIHAFLPYLSTYMGHSRLSDTAYYIHLLPANLMRSTAVDWESLSLLIPEVAE